MEIKQSYLIDFYIFLAVTELTAIQNALNTMASLLQGCVTFKSRTNEKDYISIQKGHGYGYKNTS